MPPLILLFLLIALSVTAVSIDAFHRNRTHCALRRLAGECHLHFSPYDQLRLTSRVATYLPIPGVGYLRVMNLIYGIDGGRHRYIFTAEYTAGVIRSKKRIRRAATFSEPRQRSDNDQPCSIQLAPANLSLVEQYRTLLGVNSPPSQSTPTNP